MGCRLWPLHFCLTAALSAWCVACFLCLATQLDDTCTLQPGAAQHSTADPGSMPVTGMLRLIAAVALFLEGLAGVYIPVLLRSVQGYEW